MREMTLAAEDDTASYTRMTPEELLACFVAGDESAFSRLVEQIGDRLFGFICRFLGNHHNAEDVYQAVLVRVATHAGTFDGRARLSTWVYRIARNACLDEKRKAARKSTLPLETEEHGLIDILGVDDPSEQKMEQEELGLLISRAVEGLPDEQREVFLLKEDADLTFEEIGEMLGCGRETAKSRMRYAIRKLQNSLGAIARAYGLSPESESE